jgi:hypothetical protein
MSSLPLGSTSNISKALEYVMSPIYPDLVDGSIPHPSHNNKNGYYAASVGLQSLY